MDQGYEEGGKAVGRYVVTLTPSVASGEGAETQLVLQTHSAIANLFSFGPLGPLHFVQGPPG